MPSATDDGRDPIEWIMQDSTPGSDDYAVRVIDRLLNLATLRGASDIHLDASDAAQYLMRLRIDGQLTTLGHIQQGTTTSLASRLKSMAGLLTYRHDIPQEGRITFGSPPREARIATFPTLHGERIAIRLVEASTQDWQLDSLGMNQAELAIHEQALSSDAGVVIISGAVGTGKTTTGYAALRWLLRRPRPNSAFLPAPARNRQTAAMNALQPGNSQPCIVTLEDPIECAIEGVAQSQIDPSVGFDWTSGLRSLVRQDPEIVFISEIRDSHTAQLVFRASMSGLLVITTLHARSPGEALLRLLDMQVPTQHLISSLRLLSCQRLTPTNCDCEQGCQRCSFTGVRGRHLSLSILPPLEGDLARLILQGTDLDTLEKVCQLPNP